MSHVLITGGAGYIGSTMTGVLLDAGHDVTVLDRFFFGDTLAQYGDRVTKIQGDIRTCDASVMDGIDAVFDLAALSNDPAGDLDQEKTLEINHQGRARICRMAKDAGVGRYVLASSCSIYGFQDEVVDETSDINPLTTYAVANRKAEESNLPLADDDFCVTALRQATVFGLSPRMRFDLAINGMTRALHDNGSVRVMRDGTQWRPMVHVRDTSHAFLTVLEADPALVNGEIFNVGDESLNLQVAPLARRLSEAVGIPFVEDWYGDVDHRSYQVSFAKIKQTLGYQTQVTPEDAAREIFAALKDGTVESGPKSNTLGWYKELLENPGDHEEILIDGKVF